MSRDYVIINGKNSLEVQGLAIKLLPPISKPTMRTIREEIDGRDGDIVTNLGYQAYDKAMEIGLFGTYDINDVIAFFNSEGTIVFSDESDKYYNFKILDKIDYTALIKFRTATITIHCQPFKYPLNETPLEEEYEYIEATGSNVTLNNTSEAIFNKIDLLGNTEQTQYTGKNKLKYAYSLGYSTEINGVTWTINQDGTITANGTASSLSIFTFATGTEIADLIGQSVSFNGTPTGTDSEIYLGVYNQDWSAVRNVQAGQDQTFTMPSTATRVLARVGNGKTANNVVFKPMIRISSVTDATYEPYVGGIPSPNPNYPQDIHVVSGDNEITITNSNLIGLDTSQYKVNFVAGDKFTMKNTSTTSLNINLYKNYGDSTRYDFWSLSAGATRTIEITQETKAIAWNNSVGTNGVAWVNKGDTILPYEAYQSQAFQISLGTLKVAKLSNAVKDYFKREGDKWYLHEAVGKVVFDENTTGWGKQSTSTTGLYRYNKTYDDLKAGYKMAISNYFTMADTMQFASIDTECFATHPQSHQFSFFIKIADTSDWSTWLGTHNTECLYVKTTPTDIEITNETLKDQLEAIKNAISYKGQTNISQTNNDLPFVLDLSALKENSDHLVIDNIGNIYSKPTLDLEGTGIVDIYLNDSQMFEVDLSEKNEIVIDTEKMEAYNPTDNTLANRQVTGDYSKFKLDSGENDLRFSGNLTKATITNYERWL